ncbi:MAG TPA: glycosyltransferase [Planctomycetota bacterium]|nr:glycosyltransferase [Planctomycetota bacterium]
MGRRTRGTGPGAPAAATAAAGAGRAPAATAPRFSIVSCVYGKSPAAALLAARDSVLAQTATCEWIVLAQGPLPPELDQALELCASASCCRILRRADNAGIVRGLRQCLEAATGDYVCPLDADDLLAAHALSALSAAIDAQHDPAFIFSDEDSLDGDRHGVPYLRPGFDPVLNLSSSYVWHLCAMRRERALALEVFSDPLAEWCQDWDTVMRFCAAGERIVHVAEVLYHWRRHDASSTHRADPEQRSLSSQHAVLAKELGRRGLQGAVDIVPFPIPRGGPAEWWLRLLQPDPHAVTDVPYGEALPLRSALVAAAHAATSPLLLLRHAAAAPLDAAALAEAELLFRLHDDLAVLAPRILDARGVVVHSGGWFDTEAMFDPFAGRPRRDAGPFALALKHRSVAAPAAAAFFVRTAFARAIADALPADGSPALIAAWIGALATERSQRTAATPAIEVPCTAVAVTMPPEEYQRLRRRFPAQIPSASTAVYRRLVGVPPGVPDGRTGRSILRRALARFRARWSAS